MKTSMLDRFNRYLAAQAALPDIKRPPVPLSIITISREAGAGGLAIAGMLADRLTADQPASVSTPWAVFDANLARLVLEDHKLPPHLEAFMSEEAKHPIEEIVEEVLGLHPSRWTMVQHTTKTILRLAGLGHAILVGGANIITAHFPNVLHVRLVSPLSARVRYTADRSNLSDAEAANILREQDDSRRRYLRVYFNADIDDPSRYDITINTGRLGFARSVDMIAHLAKQHEKTLRSRQTQDAPHCYTRVMQSL